MLTLAPMGHRVIKRVGHGSLRLHRPMFVYIRIIFLNPPTKKGICLWDLASFFKHLFIVISKNVMFINLQNEKLSCHNMSLKQLWCPQKSYDNFFVHFLQVLCMFSPEFTKKFSVVGKYEKIVRLRVCRKRERQRRGGRKRALLLWGTTLWSPFKLWPSMLSNIVSQTCSPPGFKLCSKGSPLWGSSV